MHILEHLLQMYKMLNNFNFYLIGQRYFLLAFCYVSILFFFPIHARLFTKFAKKMQLRAYLGEEYY